MNLKTSTNQVDSPLSSVGLLPLPSHSLKPGLGALLGILLCPHVRKHTHLEMRCGRRSVPAHMCFLSRSGMCICACVHVCACVHFRAHAVVRPSRLTWRETFPGQRVSLSPVELLRVLEGYTG